MKVHESKRNIRQVGSSDQVTQYKIEADAQMFEILTDKLYSNKISAVIRELSANAVDATIDAVKKGTLKEYVTFDVYLPNMMRPTFAIRDYGTGLSKEDVENIYTVFGKSVKRNTNDAIGCLGLGSKTPFAIANMFSVISYIKGKEYHYQAFRSETGVPSIRLVSEKNTDEPDGLMVSMSVHQNDISSFTRYAQEIFAWFDVLPNIKGNAIDIRQPNFSLDFQEDGIHFKIELSKNSNYYHRGTMKVIMGNIAYPVQVEYIDDTVIRTVENLCVKVPMGAVSFVPNREQLKYDEPTKAYIKRIFKAFNIAVKREIEKEIKSCKTLFEALKYHSEHCKAFHHLKLEWQSYKLDEGIPLKNLPDVTCQEVNTNWGGNLRYYGALDKLEARYDKYIVQQGATLKAAKVAHFIHTNHHHNSVVIIKDPKNKLKYTGIYESQDVVLDDALPEPPVNTTQQKERYKSILKKYNEFVVPKADEQYDMKKWWVPAEIDSDDPNETFLYCIIHSYKIKPYKCIDNSPKFFDTPVVFNKVLNAITSLTSVVRPRILALRPKDAESVKDKANWRYVDDWIGDFLPEIHKEWQKFCLQRALKSAKNHKILKHLYQKRKYQRHTPMGKIFTMLDVASRSVCKLSDGDMQYLGGVLNLGDTRKFYNMIDTALEQYPIIQELNSVAIYRDFGEKTIEAIHEYLEFIHAESSKITHTLWSGDDNNEVKSESEETSEVTTDVVAVRN